MGAANKETKGRTGTRAKGRAAIWRGGMGQWCGYGLVVALAGLSLAACGGPTGQFYVLHNQVPTAGCVIPADKGALYQGEGVLDVRVPTSSDAAYLLFPLLENDLPAEGQSGVEPNRIALSSFQVDVHFIDGSAEVGAFFAGLAGDPATAALLRYQTPWSGSVVPGGGTTAATTSAFPAAAARLLRDSNLLRDGSYARVEAKVRAVGSKLDGHITSDTFTYPIRICDGCLINSITACPVTGPVLKGGICNVGQDTPVDCCTEGAELICPATGAR